MRRVSSLFKKLRIWESNLVTPRRVMALMKLAMREKATGATDAERSASTYSSSVL